jgi:hypothetical protein
MIDLFFSFSMGVIDTTCFIVVFTCGIYIIRGKDHDHDPY